MNWIYIKGNKDDEHDVLLNMENIDIVEKTEEGTIFHMAGGNFYVSRLTEFNKLASTLRKVQGDNS